MQCIVSALLAALTAGSVLISGGAAQQQEAYLDADAFGTGFIVVGSSGRVDTVSESGKVQNLDAPYALDFVDVCSTTEGALAVGELGAAVYITSAEKVQPLDLHTTASLESVCYFKGTWFVGTDGGVLYSSSDRQDWVMRGTGAHGTITGLAATDARCVGVTDLGEVVTSTDGIQWTLLDYNEYYGKAASFSGIAISENVFWAYGEENGRSVVVTSLMGGVWGERNLEVYEGNTILNAGQSGVTAVGSDGTQAMAVTTSGEVLVLPSCVSCNVLREVSQSALYAVAHNGDMMLFAGADYTFVLESSASIRQENIKAEAARQMQQAGAYMIDVRPESDYAAGHIPGSVHIDVADIATELPKLCSDRSHEIIFYCTSGMRSGQAIETAKQLGYVNVYNLGAITNWPYGLEEMAGTR